MRSIRSIVISIETSSPDEIIVIFAPCTSAQKKTFVCKNGKIMTLKMYQNDFHRNFYFTTLLYKSLRSVDARKNRHKRERTNLFINEKHMLLNLFRKLYEKINLGNWMCTRKKIHS